MVGFDRLAPIYDLFPIPTHPERVREAIGDVRGPAVDLGGGTGRFSTELHPGRDPVVVADASRGMLTQARRRGRALAPVLADGARLPVASGAIAAVTATEAFHHFAPRQQEVLAEAARVLRKDGVLVVEEIDPSRLLGRLIELGENLALRFGSVFHEPDELARAAREVFADVRTERTGSFTYLVEAREPVPG